MIVKNVVDRIVKECRVSYLEKSCDLLIEGNWHNEVTGIVTTFMATVEVIKETASKGANLIITHEPTYFTAWDQTNWLNGDPVYLAKLKLIRDYVINIWRFHDHMHLTNPDLIYAGLVKEIGWETYHHPIEKHCFLIPQTTVKELAEFLKDKLQVKNVRVVGALEGCVERVGILVGGGSLGLGREEMPMELMRRADLDVLVCGEITEWTLCAYVRDAYQLGLNKALIVLGHNRTEEVGMKHLTVWLKSLFPELPVWFIESGEPFL